MSLTTRWAPGGLVALLCAVAACGPPQDTAEPPAQTGSSTSARPEEVPPRPTAPPVTVATDTSTPRETERWPLLEMPFVVDSEIDVVRDLRGLTIAEGTLFAVTPPDVALRIDPSTGEVTRLDLRLGPAPDGAPSFAVGGDRVWVVGGPYRDELLEIDPSTMTEVRRTRLDNDHAVRAASAEAVWLTTLRGARRIDAATGEPGPLINLPADPGWLTLGPDGDVWVSLPLAAQLAHIDGATLEVTTYGVAPGPLLVAADGDTVWVTHPPLASVSRFDIASGETTDVIPLDFSDGDVVSATLGGMKLSDDRVWVVVSYPGSAHRSGLALIDRSTGAVLGARTIPFDSHTWQPTAEGVWVHHAGRSSILWSDLDAFLNTSTSPTSHLAPPHPTSPGSRPESAFRASTQDEMAIQRASERLADPGVPSSEREHGVLASAWDRLNELAAAQPDLRIDLLDITVDGDLATSTFDVVVQGDRVILPSIVFDWERIAGGWQVTVASYCRLVEGVGIRPCP